MTDTIKRANDLAQQSGITLYKLCETNNIPYNSISKTKHRGGNLSVETIEMICQALNISMSDFFKEEEKELPCNGQLKIENF